VYAPSTADSPTVFDIGISPYDALILAPDRQPGYGKDHLVSTEGCDFFARFHYERAGEPLLLGTGWAVRKYRPALISPMMRANVHSLLLRCAIFGGA
jgi:hypothetical protein